MRDRFRATFFIILFVSLSLLSGCAGGPFTVNYSVVDGGGMYPDDMGPMYGDGVVVSSETVQYDRKGAKIISQEGLDPLEASGVKEQENLTDYGLGRNMGLEEGMGLMP